MITDFSFHAPGSDERHRASTGAGKTTLVNLLMRFYELNGGQILLDGTDIKDIKRKASVPVLLWYCRKLGFLTAP